jgi:hypothetical protein
MVGPVGLPHSHRTGADVTGLSEEMNMKSVLPSKGWEWINLILGVGFACAAFTIAGPTVAAWNAGIVGALIAYCSTAALYRYRTWTEVSNFTLGSWAAASPFVLGFASAPVTTWASIAVGICVATIATLQLLASRKGRTPSERELGSSI